MAAERKLDIFRVLDAVNAKDVEFFSKLTEEEAKALTPFVVARWMSGTSSAGQVYLINEFFNPYVFSLGNHKQLLWYLMTICNIGKKQRYVWNPLPSKKNTSKPTATRVVKEYYHYSTTDAVQVLPMLSRDDLLCMAEELGWQPDEISKLKKEVKSSKTDDVPETTPTKNAKRLLEF